MVAGEGVDVHLGLVLADLREEQGRDNELDVLPSTVRR